MSASVSGGAAVPATAAAIDEGRPSSSSLDAATARLHALAGDRGWLDITGVCAFLQVSKGTYYRMQRAGTFPIPPMRPRLTWPRYHVADCEHYLRTSAAVHASERLMVVAHRSSR